MLQFSMPLATLNIKPEYESKVQTVLACKNDIFMNALLPMFLEVYEKVCDKSEKEALERLEKNLSTYSEIITKTFSKFE
jgi:hypothetical protein